MNKMKEKEVIKGSFKSSEYKLKAAHHLTIFSYIKKVIKKINENKEV